MLEHEARVQKIAASGVIGVPEVFYFGQEGDNLALVMELVGNNLEDLLQQCGCVFSVSTTFKIAMELVDNYLSYFY